MYQILSNIVFILTIFLVFATLFASIKAEYKLYILIYLFFVMVVRLGHIELPQKNCTPCTCKCEVLSQHHQILDEE